MNYQKEKEITKIKFLLLSGKFYTYLQMAFDFIVSEPIHLHQFPDLLWRSNCKKKKKKSNLISIQSHFDGTVIFSF